ncbi:hypothetical protein BH24ACI3_BH24ACI3_00570 [soil metagenome]
MRKLFFCGVAATLLIAACDSINESAERPGANSPAKTENTVAVPPKTPAMPAEAGAEIVSGALGSKAARELCFEIDTGDFPIWKPQTFAIEFEPFADSCFVTTHNPEYDDPPMESQIAIYRKDKKVLELPGLFNGVTFGCWVDGVGFQDLNNDGRIDVVVIGKCQAKMGVYNENMVYANDGKQLITNETANAWISEMKTVKEVAAYARENPEMFFKQ